MTAENEREKAQITREADGASTEMPEVLMVARYQGTGHGGSYSGLRVATAADVARLAPKQPNTLFVIGWMGVKRCYLNISREEAIARYTQEDGAPPPDDQVTEFTFTDTFGTYDAYA